MGMIERHNKYLTGEESKTERESKEMEMCRKWRREVTIKGHKVSVKGKRGMEP